MGTTEYIQEYRGRTTAPEVNTPLPVRLEKGPKPGDMILYTVQGYPFRGNTHNNQYGRIEDVDGNWCGNGKAHICCGGGSVFLSGPESVQISGGPFSCINLSDLVFLDVRNTPFWNWGDNMAGAHQGVDFNLRRPAWLLRGGET